MSAPVISASSSILGFKRNEEFNFQPAATNAPVIWEGIGLPPGVTVDTQEVKAVTGAEATDILTSAGHGYANADRAYFPALTGGSGLPAGTIYYVRDKTDDTFKLASTLGGAAVNFTTDVTAGQVRKVSSGMLSGACSVTGTYVVTLTAVNAAAESGSRQFVIGIDSATAADAGTGGTAMDWEIEMLDRTVAGGGSAGAQAVLATWKEDDVVMVAIRFNKSGVPVDPDPDTLRLVLKEMEPETMLVEATDFEKIGDGAEAYFNLPVSLTGPLLAAALSNHEEDEGTGFDALAEIEWTSDVVHKGTPLVLKGSTKTFKVRVERDIAEG